MKNSVYIILVIAFSLFSVKGYAGGACSPATTNGTCPTGTVLVSGGGCVTGTSCGGSGEIASSCLFGGSECSWYSFIATGTTMFVDISVTATNGCHISSNVYAATGACVGVEISCQAGAPLDDLHSLTGLTIGNNYYVQVCYSPGGACGNTGKAEYCIRVDEPSAPCPTCGTPCGTAQGFPSSPTAQQVVDGCTTSPFIPELTSGDVVAYCFGFTATATSVDFNIIITSNCSPGNVSAFTWELFNSGCGAAIQTGNLSSLTFSPVVIGNSYVFCYTFTVPFNGPPLSACTQSQHCPFFIGATPLPVALTSFTANAYNGFVNLDWITESEINNDFFTVEKSSDAQSFEVIGIVDGAGNSTMVNDYELTDNNPYKGISYYRLAQTDFDGTTEYSKMIAVTVESSFGGLSVFPNPVEGLGSLTFNSNTEGVAEITIYDIRGKKILTKAYSATKGNNIFKLPTQTLPQGMYFLTIGNDKETSNTKFVKE